VADARRGLEEVIDLCRIPAGVGVQVIVGEFATALTRATQADLELFGSSHDRTLEFMAGLVGETRATCMFLADSGEEDALA
jgi:hypothetical protein